MNTSASAPRPRHRSRGWLHLSAVLTAFVLLLGTAIPAAAAELMRITFVRHGQSEGNASGSIDSSTPGPVLSPLGQQQAAAVAARLGDRNFDAIYASSMVRTQLTAAPLSQYLGLPIQVIPGLQEIEAGDYEGTPESQASSGYMLSPLAWVFQNNLSARIPGSIDGYEFNARMNGALQAIYDNGDRDAAVFSHGAAIMFWTMLNAQNLTAVQKMELLRLSLSNTASVVVEGNPTDGWTLVNWNGQQFSPERTFGAELGAQIRTLGRQLAAAAKTVVDAFASRDLATIATAINRGISAAVFSVTKFSRAVSAAVIDRLDKAFPRPAPATPITSSVPESVSATVQSPSAERARPVAIEVADSPRAVAVDTRTDAKTDADNDIVTPQPLVALETNTNGDPTDVVQTDVVQTDVVPTDEPKSEETSDITEDAAKDTESAQDAAESRTVKTPRTAEKPGPTVKSEPAKSEPAKSASAESSSPGDSSDRDSGSVKDRADNGE